MDVAQRPVAHLGDGAATSTRVARAGRGSRCGLLDVGRMREPGSLGSEQDGRAAEGGAPGRSRRVLLTPARLTSLTTLSAAEGDQEFWDQEAWQEELGDGEYESEKEEADVFDSDFEESEDDDEAEGDEEDRPRCAARCISRCGGS